MDPDLAAIFSQLASLENEPTKAKFFNEDDLGTTEVPFQLVANGFCGELSVVPDEGSTGVENTDTFSGATILPTSCAGVNAADTNFVASHQKFPSSQYLGFNLEDVTKTQAKLYEVQEVWDKWESFDPSQPGVKVSADMYEVELSLPHTTLTLCRDVAGKRSGEVTSFVETILPNVDAKASNSTSVLRAPGSLHNFARGNANNVPFRPGGLDSLSRDKSASTEEVNKDQLFPFEEKDGKDMSFLLLNSPPGFATKGLLPPAFAGGANEDQKGPVTNNSAESAYSVGVNAPGLLSDHMQVDQDEHMKRVQNMRNAHHQAQSIDEKRRRALLNSDDTVFQFETGFDGQDKPPASGAEHKMIHDDDLLELDNEIAQIGALTKKSDNINTEWAIMSRMDTTNFYQQVTKLFCVFLFIFIFIYEQYNKTFMNKKKRYPTWRCSFRSSSTCSRRKLSCTWRKVNVFSLPLTPLLAKRWLQSTQLHWRRNT